VASASWPSTTNLKGELLKSGDLFHLGSQFYLQKKWSHAYFICDTRLS